jgi:prepilin peptidase CpaA|nr:prepilin peptidase [Sphingomonas bacterium]
MPGNIQLLLLAALIVLLMRAVWRDLADRTISNRLNAVVALLAPVSWYVAGLSLWPDVALQIGLAAIVFGLFTAAFALRMMGGGDVKLLTALALWRVPLVPGEPMFAPLLSLLTIMALAGGILTIGMVVRHRRRKAPGQPEIPYGVAIAVGAVAAYGQRYFNQFG